MECRLHGDVPSFAAVALRWLEADPVLHNVLCTVTYRLGGAGPAAAPGRVLATVHREGGAVIGAALRTPPRHLLLSALPPPAAEVLAERLSLGRRSLPGAYGPVDAVRAFVEAWSGRTGATAALGMAQRIYRLDRVDPPRRTPGELAVATEADLPLVTAWLEGFAQDVGTGEDVDAGDKAVELTGGGRLWLWRRASVPVSMAAAREPVVGVCRVSAVYTPPAERRRGCAAACVAALSQLLLDRGAVACTLNTDLANPTSNAVYQRVGYRPVADAETWTFRPPGP